MADFDDALEVLGITEADIFEAEEQKIMRALDQTAERVETAWIGISPEDTGDYKDAFGIRDIVGPDGTPGRRVTNSSKHAHIVEYGSDDTKALSPRAKVANRFNNEGPYTVQGAQ